MLARPMQTQSLSRSRRARALALSLSQSTNLALLQRHVGRIVLKAARDWSVAENRSAWSVVADFVSEGYARRCSTPWLHYPAELLGRCHVPKFTPKTLHACRERLGAHGGHTDQLVPRPTSAQGWLLTGPLHPCARAETASADFLRNALLANWQRFAPPEGKA